MDMSQYSVGVQSKSTYISKGTPRGVASGRGEDPQKAFIEAKRPNVELYTERWEQGLDIWTGEPLEGGALADWQSQRKLRNKRSNLLS